MTETASQTAIGSAEVSDRDKWLADRRDAIGASDLAAVLGLSPWATPWEVWAEKRGMLEPWSGNDATRAGIAFEGAVLDHAESELGELRRNVRIAAESLPLAATCDAIVSASGEPVEAKTTGLVGPVHGSWGDALTDEIPEHYLVQVHAQLMCTGAELGYLFAMIAGRGVVEYHIVKSAKLHEHIGNQIADWWERHIVQGHEPSRDRLPSLDVVKRLRRVPKMVYLSDEAAELLEKKELAKVTCKAGNELIESIDTQLLLMLGDAEAGVLPDGRHLTYMEQSRKGYTVQPSTYRTLRVKRVKK